MVVAQLEELFRPVCMSFARSLLLEGSTYTMECPNKTTGSIGISASHPVPQ